MSAEVIDATQQRPDPYPGEEPLLRAESLTAGYLPGIDILTDCGVELFEGELVGIIGPNGAGKSTMVKSLFGLVDVRDGRVVLRGEDITNLPAHALVAKGVGYVPQTNNVFPSLTIEENLEMGSYLAPKDFESSLDRVAGIFPLLSDRRKQRAGGLSGGERQMVAMGRALMMDPSVLLLDEPSAGLSPDLQDEVFLQTRDINASGVSIVMVEQNARRCLQICHRGYVLDQGTDAYTGAGDALLHDPKVIDLYLGTLAQQEAAAEGDTDGLDEAEQARGQNQREAVERAAAAQEAEEQAQAAQAAQGEDA